MCNSYRSHVPLDLLKQIFPLPMLFPEGAPNMQPRDEIRIAEIVPILVPAEAGAALVSRPWSWRGPHGSPVFNFRSEGRRFAPGRRCAIPADGFYEFTAPPAGSKRKTRWLFTMAAEPVFFIAGYLTDGAWAMLTVDPGPDVASYHDRQVVVLRPGGAAAWLQGGPEAELLRATPAGTLRARQIVSVVGTLE